MQIACKLLRHSERPRVILSAAKNLLWTNAQFLPLRPMLPEILHCTSFRSRMTGRKCHAHEQSELNNKSHATLA
ncbi:MAG: hypothetical protein ACI35T_07255 [Alistipes sp.]